MKQATTSTVGGVVSTRTGQYRAYDSDATRTTTTTDSSTTNNTKKANTKSNPLAIHCPSLLNDFLHGKVPEMEIRQGFEKSYVTRTNTPNPFYWSTHKGELDMPRHAAFEKGEYYEQELTARVVEAYPQVEKDTKEQEEEEDIFLDVGGNIGWYSLVAASQGAKKVYTFEPNPSNVVRICESLRLNDWTDVVDVMMVGVSDTAGGKQKLFKVDPNNPGMFSFDENRAKKFNHGNPDAVSGEFQLVTLDEFAQNMGWLDQDDVLDRDDNGDGASAARRQAALSIRFFKLDVEGFEPRIIRGAEKLFRSRIIKLFAMEMKRKLHSDEDKKLIIKLLFESGYELYQEGAWKGPKNVVKKNYSRWEDLAQDIIDRKYGENLLFRRIGEQHHLQGIK